MKRFFEGVNWLAFVIVIVIQSGNATTYASPNFMNLPDGSKCFSDRFVIVVKPGTPALAINSTLNDFAVTGIFSLDNLCRANRIVRIDPWYPYEVIHEETLKLVERMYIFYVSEGIDIVGATESFSDNPYIEISEPYRVPESVRVPNDPSRSLQWFFSKIDAYQAWDIIWGSDTEISIIAIVDTGVYWTHPDIYPNMWSGIGEDMYNYDGDPREPYPIHGTHVAGCASEATNNGIGGAGIGWAARIMAVKGADNNGNLTHVWQGITWAADHGAHIINCSWGGIGYSSYEYNIIYHVWSAHDVLVVASAGNDNYWTPPYVHYPSAYNHVLAVAATNSSDNKPGWSNYGTWVDVCAPGQSIYSTWGASSYTYLSGTSMSSPIVAGIAALVRAADPGLSASQTEAMIVDGAEPINDYYYNQGWMGSGRVNANGAVEGLINILEPPNLLSPAENQFLNDHYPTFIWNTSESATVYHLQVDNDPSFGTPVINNSSITDTTYASTSYMADDIWYWRIRSGDAGEWSDWSTTENFGIDTQPPASPIGFDAIPDGWSNDPAIVLNWTNPADLSGINFALYKLDQPPANNYDFDGLTALDGEPPGEYVFPFTGTHTIYLWLVDNADNIDYTTYVQDDMQYDGTPPAGCVASSPVFSSELSFEVSWTAGSDEHSGISGVYDIQYKDGDGSWTPWLTGFDGTSETFTGEDGHTYYFEARGYDIAGNAEPFTDNAETETTVDTEYIPGCDYVSGDVNYNGIPVELGDVIAIIGLYRGTLSPYFTCDCPPHGDEFAASSDPNGNCVAFELNDVVVEIGAFRGNDTASGCADCPGSRLSAPDIPTLKSKVEQGISSPE